MATRATSDLPTPYVGQLVHYVNHKGEHIAAHITKVLKIDGKEPGDNLNPAHMRTIDPSIAAEPTPFGAQQSDAGQFGTWHEITAACAQVVTEVETDPSKRQKD